MFCGMYGIGELVTSILAVLGLLFSNRLNPVEQLNVEHEAMLFMIVADIVTIVQYTKPFYTKSNRLPSIRTVVYLKREDRPNHHKSILSKPSNRQPYPLPPRSETTYRRACAESWRSAKL